MVNKAEYERGFTWDLYGGARMENYMIYTHSNGYFQPNMSFYAILKIILYRIVGTLGDQWDM